MKKILLIEDDMFLVRVYKVKLKSMGHEVLYLENGLEAVRVAREQKPDLILLDIVMPGKDGFQVLRELKQEKETSSIPVIVLTNLSGEDDREAVLKLGASDFAIKSMNTFSEVTAKIQRMLV